MLKWDLFAKLTVFLIILAIASFGLAFFLNMDIFLLLMRGFVVLAVVCFIIKIGRALFSKEIQQKRQESSDNNPY